MYKKIIYGVLFTISFLFFTPFAFAEPIQETNLIPAEEKIENVPQIKSDDFIAIVPMKMMILSGTQAYLEKSINDAAEKGASLVILVLDTPGGVITNTQEMIQTIFSSPVPVIVYVAPSGAMAASAGTFITLAGHVAAMAPGTSIGAAHPIQGDGKDIDGDLRTKTENITVAMMKSVSDQRGRNSEWVEKSIKESSSLTPKEALELKVIDLIADDIDDLLKKIEGMEVEVNGEKKILGDYTNFKRVDYTATFKDEVINFLANPNILAILWFVATTGIALELYHPGTFIPGVVGIIALFLALGVSQVIPVSSAGVMLIIIGGLLIGAEIFVTTGIMGIGGVLSMVFGAIYLIDDTLAPGLGVSLDFIIPVAILLSAFVFLIIWNIIKAFSSKEVTGEEGMVGQVGYLKEDMPEEKNIGRVFVNGEYWNCVLKENSPKLNKDDKVKVVAVKEGLLLVVEKVK